MNRQQYIEELSKMKVIHSTERRQLDLKFVEANNKIKVGDVITVRSRSIIVDEIDIILPPNTPFPECAYRGRLLTKKGKPRKDGKIIVFTKTM